MKEFLVFVSISIFLTFDALGQKISETEFSFGINSSNSTDLETYWVAPLPNNLIFNATKSWYSNQHRIFLRKELGLNLQYSNIRYGRGNLVESNIFKGSNVSLFSNTALLDHFQISSKLAFSLGSEVEILLIGNNNLKKSYHTTSINPPSSGIKYERGLNRNYFNHPSYGLKARLFESEITERTTFAIVVSYLWTKSEFSNFYASNYTRISF